MYDKAMISTYLDVKMITCPTFQKTATICTSIQDNLIVENTLQMLKTTCKNYLRQKRIYMTILLLIKVQDIE